MKNSNNQTIKNNIKPRIQLLSILFILLVAGISSCKEKVDEPDIDNEEELITTVEVQLTDTISGTTQIFRFEDLDGEGGNAPTTDSIKINANAIYSCAVKFLDESDPLDIEDITEEVLEEGADHHLCLLGLSALNITMSFEESDNNGFPIPVNSLWTVGNSSTGDLTIKLKHQEGGHSHTDCDEGETDVEVVFPTAIN